MFCVVSCQKQVLKRTVFLSEDGVILAFGDSLTSGSGATIEESYPSQLSKLTGHTVINAGVPGEVSSIGKSRLPALIKKHQPQLVILCHGGNDLLRKMSREKLKQNLEAMITTIKKQGISIILIGVPVPRIPLRTAKLYTELAQTYKLAFAQDLLVDLFSNRSFKSDATHLNAKGYMKMAERIAQHIK